MQQITHELEIKRNGNKTVRVFFLYDDNQNLLIDAQKQFTKSERKEAKLNYAISLKSTLHQERRKDLVEHLVKQPFPNWNIKVGFLK